MHALWGLPMLAALFHFLFRQPPLPPINLPITVRMVPGVKQTISQAFTLAYERGVFDGFIAGVLLSLLLVPSIRTGVAKGVGHVAEHL
jgi:hypothetical protein